MKNQKINPKNNPAGICYEIRVGASLEAETVEWIGNFEAACTPDGDTLLTGILPDQPALFGALLRLRDLGLPLVSVNHIQSDGEAAEMNKEEQAS